LTANGIEFESVDYIRNQALSENELKKLLHSAGLKPKDALRTNEAAYREHVAGRNLSDEQLLGVMAEHPELIQRPIVVRGNKAVLARPVENLAKLGIK
jgi:arsenate reductase